MSLHGFSVIAGVAGQPGGATFHAVNPTSSAIMEPPFHEATGDDLARATEAAATAFADYRARTGAERAKLLETIASEIEALGDALIYRAHAESGLPLPRLTGERGRTCGQLRLFAALVREGSWVDARIDPALPDRQPLPRADIRRMLVALGPVAVFGSSNFPLAFSVAGGDTASALAAGCPVVVKAHPAHPGTSELVATAINRALVLCDLPAGIFSLLHGGPAVGVALVQHPAIMAVGFTGSHAAGRALLDAAAARRRPIPVFAEMSSVNPLFVLPGAQQERGPAIAQGLLGSFTLGVGQFCTKPGLVFVTRGPATYEFQQKLAELVRAAPCGTMLTSGIRESFLANRARLAAIPGVQILAAGGANPNDTRTEAQPSVATTTAENFLGHSALASEIFGPFTLVVIAEDLAELTACAAVLDGQLTATVHGNAADLATAGPLLTALERIAGRVTINGFPTGVEVSPAMNHGGPYPATTDTRFTSVGTAAILRFARPVCYQSFPDAQLPAALQNANPLGLMRLVDGKPTREGM